MREVAVASTETEHAKARWSEAIESIASSPKYAGQRWPSGERLTPQVGLLPLGENPATGLWELVHLQSGTEPKIGADGRVLRDAEGRLSLTPEMGMVFVLLPGGRVPKDPSGPSQEKWIPDVELVPFFLSKYELTHEQWDRLSVLKGVAYRKETAMVPANRISWDDISAIWPRELGWSGFPSETQWEYGCRAGTTTRWWTGDDKRFVSVAANLGDSILPVGGLQPNAFGLHDVHGNVYEWCGDSLAGSAAPRPGDGLRDEGVELTSYRVLRGGSWDCSADNATSAYRLNGTPEYPNIHDGLRPARGITP